MSAAVLGISLLVSSNSHYIYCFYSTDEELKLKKITNAQPSPMFLSQYPKRSGFYPQGHSHSQKWLQELQPSHPYLRQKERECGVGEKAKGHFKEIFQIPTRWLLLQSHWSSHCKGD